jgi:hypothetical protein
MNFFSTWRVSLVSRMNFFQLAKPSRTSLNKDEARQIAANVAEAAGPAAQGLMLNSTRLFGVQFLLDAYVACAYPPRIGQEQAIIANPSPLPAALDKVRAAIQAVGRANSQA